MICNLALSNYKVTHFKNNKHIAYTATKMWQAIMIIFHKWWTRQAYIETDGVTN
jgi:hypothetical protein